MWSSITSPINPLSAPRAAVMSCSTSAQPMFCSRARSTASTWPRMRRTRLRSLVFSRGVCCNTAKLRLVSGTSRAVIALARGGSSDRLPAGAAHDGAVGQRDLDELTAVRSVAKRMDGQPDRHAGGERLRPPALAREAVGAVHLDRPLLGASLAVDRENHPGMGIGPLELVHGPLQGYLPVGIESGKGVVREGRRCVEQQDAAE